MIFPNCSDYIEAVCNVKGRLQTISGDVAPVYDNAGEPVFHATNGTLNFEVLVDGRPMLLRVFTSDEALQRVTLKCDTKEIYPSELYVNINGEQGDYYTIILAGLCPTHVLEEVENCEYNEGKTSFCDADGLWGYKDIHGQVIIEARYDSVFEFGEGRAVVEKGGMWGLIDDKGDMVVPLEYDDLSWDGSAMVYGETNGLWGAFNRTGELVIPFEWDWLGEFSDGRCVVMRDGKYGYVDTSGVLVIGLIYDDASSFNVLGYAHVRKGEKEFHIDKNQKRV